MELELVGVEMPEGANVILGQTHFIKTIEDLYEIMVTAVPGAKFGIAFAEASGPCLIRHEGNDEELSGAAVCNVEAIGAGHLFCLLMRDAYPINVLNRIKDCPEVCHVFCATANPLKVVVGVAGEGRAVLGVVDGFSPRGVETAEDQAQRKEFLRKIGYKL